MTRVIRVQSAIGLPQDTDQDLLNQKAVNGIPDLNLKSSVVTGDMTSSSSSTLSIYQV